MRVREPNPAQEATVSLMVAADHLAQALGAICARYGITGEQYNMLRILRGAHPAGQPRGEVARHCPHRAPDVTRMLDRLVRQGLVKRARAAEDRRCSMARITKTGLKLLARIDPEISAAMQRLTQSLSPTELRQLTRLSDALVR
jgi:DNA-binding MarR family transcriptional regulator